MKQVVEYYAHTRTITNVEWVILPPGRWEGTDEVGCDVSTACWGLVCNPVTVTDSGLGCVPRKMPAMRTLAHTPGILTVVGSQNTRVRNPELHLLCLVVKALSSSAEVTIHARIRIKPTLGMCFMRIFTVYSSILC